MFNAISPPQGVSCILGNDYKVRSRDQSISTPSQTN